jgi:16S rRNA (uracil1498-N3)-methyltransferase
MTTRTLWPELAGRASGERVVLTGPAAHHLARVVRLRRDEVLVLFDGQGHEARARVTEIAAGREPRIAVDLIEPPRAGVTADGASVIWLQGYPKADKLERIARQATELGVRAIWPVFTARSVPRTANNARIERLCEIVASASAQCGRADLPEVRAPGPLAAALEAVPSEVALRIVPWEGGGANVLEVARAAGPGGCAVLVGPEGGLDASEVELAQRAGFVPVSLGPRVLRTETVAAAMLALLSVTRGDLRSR